MAVRTGRKVAASKETKAKAVAIKQANPQLSSTEIARRLSGVTARQVQYWLSKKKS